MSSDFSTNENAQVVDRAARDKAALLLRRFAAGRLTNDDFEDGMPMTHDPAIRAIWDTAWLYYSDMKPHALTGAHRLHPDAKRAWIRWILFLDSDFSYEWPNIRHPGNDPTAKDQETIIALIRWTFGLPSQVVKRKAFDEAGHYPVWPFISQSDHRHVLRNPRRLARKRRA